MADQPTKALPEGPRGHQRLRVVVIQGRDQGKSVVVDDAVLVGTSAVCDLKLTDRTVSRRHVLVQPTEIGLKAIDQQSRNGTWCRDGRIVEIDLKEGAEIRLGNTTLAVEREDTSTAPDAGQPLREGFGRFLGRARCLQPMYRNLESAAVSGSTVLIEGESGTGKELLAEALHEQSPRAGGPYEVVDLGAVPANLMESHLFGHQKGAFTGATASHIGAFERANGGTVFLDEIGEMPLELQTSLLRVLDQRQIRRVGGTSFIDVDARVIAATNRNLDREVEQKRFRVDLFYRLAVVFIRVPPLRDRVGDVELLVRHYLASSGADSSVLTQEVLARAHHHSWPGNVRELRNFVERLTIFGHDAAMAPAKEAASDPLRAAANSGLPFRHARERLLESFTEIYVDDMLRRHGGSVSKAAEAAGIARRYFQMLKKGG